MRMKVTRIIQELAPGHPGEPLSCKDQRDLVPRGGKLLEPSARLVRRANAHDAVVPCVTVAQLSLYVTQRLRILVNGHKYGATHAFHSNDACSPAVRGPRLPARARVLVAEVLEALRWAVRWRWGVVLGGVRRRLGWRCGAATVGRRRRGALVRF